MRNHDLPRGDRNEVQEPVRDTSAPPVIPNRAGRGFCEYLEALSKDPSVVPVYVCLDCGDDFNHEPVTDGERHPEEAKRKGRTWCSVRCLRRSLAAMAVRA